MDKRPFPQPSEPELVLLRDLIQERMGLLFENGRMELLADKLKPLLADKSIGSFIDYYYLLKYDGSAGDEWRRVESALAVNETYFWREFDTIKAAVEMLLPQMQKERAGKPVRIWHAASATGEEPYSMAIALTEAGLFNAGPIWIVATDFNAEAIALARAGIYRKRSFRSIPPNIVQRYFTPVGEEYRLADSIRGRVLFAHLNLLDGKGMGRMRDFDLIFCRNAFIYFSDTAIRQVAESFYQSLRDGGYLFLAAAESLLRLTTRFELVQVANAFGYQKTPAGVPGLRDLLEGQS